MNWLITTTLWIVILLRWCTLWRAVTSYSKIKYVWLWDIGFGLAYIGIAIFIKIIIFSVVKV